MLDHPGCPFCQPERVVGETEYFYIVRDAYPVNEGHLLAVLKRHEPSFLEIDRQEWDDLYHAVHRARKLLAEELQAEQFNIGVNIGVAAGQTIPHVHIHMIPRQPGDCDNPRGGVRNVKPPLVDY